MKPIAVIATLLLIAPSGFAQDDAAPDPTKVLGQLVKANAEKDVTSISILLKTIVEIGQTSKSADEVDPIALALASSFKLAKGNGGVERDIVKAMGELRSTKSTPFLKRLAFKKKVKNKHEEGLQVSAIGALAILRDPKMVKKLADLTKNRNVEIAKATYACFKAYGPSPGKVRKGVAELLMKRLEAEKPAAGQGGKVSAVAQERWQKLEKPMLESMQAVCRQDTINDLENWREWWKEYKKDNKYWKDKKKKKDD